MGTVELAEGSNSVGGSLEWVGGCNNGSSCWVLKLATQLGADHMGLKVVVLVGLKVATP